MPRCKNGFRRVPAKTGDCVPKTSKTRKRCQNGYRRATHSNHELGIVKGVTCVMSMTNPKFKEHLENQQKEILRRRNAAHGPNYKNGPTTFGADELERWKSIKTRRR